MAIRQTKYIDITSGVGGGSAVSDRELIARVFTTNELCGIGHVYEFKDLSSVMEHFGSTSDEYKTAEKYFGFVAKDIVAPKKMSFFGYSIKQNADDLEGHRNAYVQATAPAEALSLYGQSNCRIKLTLGVETFEVDSTTQIGGIKFADAIKAAANLQAVGDTVAEYVTQVLFGSDESDSDANNVSEEDACTCVLANSRFRFTFPESIKAEVIGFGSAETDTDAQKDLATLMGIGTSASPVRSNFTMNESPLEALVRSDGISDNFGSFYFLTPYYNSGKDPETGKDIWVERAISKGEAKDVAAWNMTKNYKYLYIVGQQGYTTAQGGLAGNVADWVAKDTGLAGYVGTTVWAYKTKDDRIESLPAALLATTDYSRANSTQTYMYQMNDLISAAITNDKTSQQLDDLNVNYMGVTQSAGGLIQFTQDGNNMDGVETGVYCNELWMKASFWTAIMNLFLAVKKVSANDEGAGLIKTVMMPIITTAIKNGTIMPRKPLTTTQKVYISQVTGNSDAWMDVYNDGYTLEIKIENVNNRFVAKYILVYSKGDAVRKVEGTDILI